MPRATWPLRHGCPSVQIVLMFGQDDPIYPLPLDLHADSGAGSMASVFDLILRESDCWLCNKPIRYTPLGGAYSGNFPVFRVRVQIPALGFDDFLDVVGVPSAPVGFEGIAGFRFLSRFTYGNFDSPAEFGLEV